MGQSLRSSFHGGEGQVKVSGTPATSSQARTQRGGEELEQRGDVRPEPQARAEAQQNSRLTVSHRRPGQKQQPDRVKQPQRACKTSAAGQGTARTVAKTIGKRDWQNGPRKHVAHVAREQEGRSQARRKNGDQAGRESVRAGTHNHGRGDSEAGGGLQRRRVEGTVRPRLATSETSVTAGSVTRRQQSGDAAPSSPRPVRGSTMWPI